MTNQVLDWLPLDAMTRAPLRAKLDEAVSGWAGAWFTQRSINVSRLTAVSPSAAAAGWQLYRSAVAVKRSDTAAGRMLDWALDADVARLSASDVDKRLVEAFERRLIEDLVGRIEEALSIDGQFLSKPGVAHPFEPHGGIAAEVVDEKGDLLLVLAAPLSAMLPQCRATLAPRSKSLADLTRLAHAIADVKVNIEAVLGAARLSLPDAKTLEAGDVLVLDTSLEGAANLTLVESRQVFARAKLADSDGEMALKLQACK